MFSTILQLELPAEFPLVEFESFVTSVRNATSSESVARCEFNGASNLIGWRFRACVEYRLSYLASWKALGGSAGFEDIYARERDMYGMFACGLSTLESVTYACFAVASDTSVLSLPFSEKIRRNRSGPKYLAESLAGQTCGGRLHAALQTMLASDEWELWTDYRNTMSHRSNIPRILYASAGSAPPPSKIMQFSESWSHGPLDGDEVAFDSLGAWLTSTVRELLIGGEQLARAV
jgi:hypothetical protein